MKKVAFVISDQHLIPHGGIGSFCKSFCEMQDSFGNEVHIVTDKKPTNNFVHSFTNQNIHVKYNDKPLSYSKHQNIFMYGESVNYERIINFQNIMEELLKNHSYDYIVANSQEAFAALAVLDTKCKVILYTHLYKQIYPDANIHDVFLPAYHIFYGQFLKMEHLIVGTQSELNKESLISQGCVNVEVLPMPISERELLVESKQDKRGVLFIGRWEKGKNPEAYIKVMRETGLPCKVMTNSNGEKKFIKAFKQAGITDYEIKVGITGKEKVDFLKTCKVSFNTSLIENYPFAFIECVGHMPVVVLDKQSWADNFDNRFYIRTTEKNAVEAVRNAYNITEWSTAIKYVNELNQKAFDAWSKV